MNELPAEMVMEVLQWLEVHDLASGQRVCRSWRRLLRCDGANAARQGLWRGAYLRTWPPPLAPTAAGGAEPSTHNDEDEDEDEQGGAPSQVDWKNLCMLRLRLQHNNSLKQRMAAVARALRSGAEAALMDPSQFDSAQRKTTKRRRSDPAPSKQGRGSKAKAGRGRGRGRAKAGRGKSKAEVEQEEEEEEFDDDAAVITGLPPLAGPWTDPPQMVEARRLTVQAEEIVSSFNEIAFMRDKTQQVLAAISVTAARGREVKRLLSWLFDHTLHDSVSAFLGSTMTLEGPYVHKVRVVMFSLATGLPLRMEWDCVNGIEGEPNDQRQAWSSDDGSICFETDNPDDEEADDDVEADDEHAAALMEFLFGAAHARVVRPAELESVFRALFTPTNCPSTFELKLQPMM